MYHRLVDRSVKAARMFRSVCRKHGFVRTLRLGLSELLFDFRNQTETSLDVRSGSLRSRNKYGGHEGSNPLLFAELIRHVSLDRGRSVFLDYGAGKGRALLLAAQHGFKKTIGVESCAELCSIAQRNIATYHERQPQRAIEVHCTDAALFEVPDEVNVAYFFNPFGPDVMRAALNRILESLRRCPREFLVVYLYPSFEESFIKAGFIVICREGTDGAILRWA